MAIFKVYDGTQWIEVPILDGTPGGELGGTWASPTVDAIHSGSPHHDESHVHGNYTVIEFWPAVIHVNAAQANVGTIAYVAMDDTQKMSIMGILPDNWVSTTSVKLIMHPDATETLTADFDISSIADGEALTDNQATNPNETHEATATVRDDWDITSLMPAGAAGDLVCIRIDSDTDAMGVVGIKIVYVRTP